MKQFAAPAVLLLTVLLAGCGPKLDGRYVMESPRIQMPAGTDPKIQRQMDAIAAQSQDSMQMTLEFDGHTVKMGTGYAIMEYKYSIKGRTLEVKADAMGQKVVLPMTIEDDGSISYMGMRYRRVP